MIKQMSNKKAINEYKVFNHDLENYDKIINIAKRKDRDLLSAITMFFNKQDDIKQTLKSQKENLTKRLGIKNQIQTRYSNKRLLIYGFEYK